MSPWYKDRFVVGMVILATPIGVVMYIILLFMLMQLFNAVVLGG